MYGTFKLTANTSGARAAEGRAGAVGVEVAVAAWEAIVVGEEAAFAEPAVIVV